jgi:hypothetical protein
MLSQTILNVSAYQRYHQGDQMILTSYLYDGVHYRRNDGISSEVVPVSIVTLGVQVTMTSCLVYTMGRVPQQSTASSRG